MSSWKREKEEGEEICGEDNEGKRKVVMRHFVIFVIRKSSNFYLFYCSQMEQQQHVRLNVCVCVCVELPHIHSSFFSCIAS